jgi:signal transduction histidine kinase
VGDATFSFIVVGIVFVLGRVMHARRSERAMAEAEALRHGRQAAIDAAIADERRRMAREIHDVVANGISVMAIQAGAAERLMDEDPGAAKASLQRIRATGHDVVREKGRLVELLRGDDGAEAPTEQSPSLASLDHLVGRMRSAGLDVRVTTAGVPASMGADVETTAFRLVQEGLTNQLKHAPDAPVTVTVRYSDAAVEVEVVGGFATTSTIRGPGHGIEGLRERTDSLGGDFEAGPYEGGWRMRALLPAT